MLSGPLMFSSLAIWQLIFLVRQSGFEVNLLGREYQCRVTGVHAGEFDVFRDRVIDDLTGVRYRVELDLFCIFEEFGDHDRILFRHLRGDAEEMFHFLFGVADAHGGSRKHVGRTDQYREAYAVDEFVHVVIDRKLFPLRLVDAEVVEPRPRICAGSLHGRSKRPTSRGWVHSGAGVSWPGCSVSGRRPKPSRR